MKTFFALYLGLMSFSAQAKLKLLDTRFEEKAKREKTEECSNIVAMERAIMCSKGILENLPNVNVEKPPCFMLKVSFVNNAIFGGDNIFDLPMFQEFKHRHVYDMSQKEYSIYLLKYIEALQFKYNCSTGSFAPGLIEYLEK